MGLRLELIFRVFLIEFGCPDNAYELIDSSHVCFDLSYCQANGAASTGL
jgi:hypothetical protein